MSRFGKLAAAASCCDCRRGDGKAIYVTLNINPRYQKVGLSPHHSYLCGISKLDLRDDHPNCELQCRGNQHLVSHEKKHRFFRVCKGLYYTTQLYRDSFINHYKDPYETPRIQWKIISLFVFRGSGVNLEGNVFFSYGFSLQTPAWVGPKTRTRLRKRPLGTKNLKEFMEELQDIGRERGHGNEIQVGQIVDEVCRAQ